jgi:Tfp pilus assembly protein FimV
MKALMRPVMRRLIEIAAATFLVVCITASSAAFAAGKMGRSADGLSCGFTVPQNASPAARCAAIKRQCGGKFYASACGDRLMSAAN